MKREIVETVKEFLGVDRVFPISNTLIDTPKETYTLEKGEKQISLRDLKGKVISIPITKVEEK